LSAKVTRTQTHTKHDPNNAHVPKKEKEKEKTDGEKFETTAAFDSFASVLAIAFVLRPIV